MNFLTEYGGWSGLAIYFFYKEVWPLIIHKLIPAKIKELDDERSFHRTVETERLAEVKKMSDAVQELAVYMSQTNERITSILAGQQLILTRQDSTFSVLTDGIADMRAVTGVKHKDSE